jgi:hypothetical protein
MAELSTAETTADPCCAPEQQATCCEPSAKDDCCGHDEGCGCAAGTTTQASYVREQVRERYAAAAIQVTSTDPGAGCCAPSETFEAAARYSAPRSTRSATTNSYPTQPSSPPLAAATPPPSPGYTRARRSSTSAPAAGLTFCSPPSASARPARRTGWT